MSQQPSYNIVAHTYNMINNKQPRKNQAIPMSILLPQPIFPSAPRLPSHTEKEYDLVEQL